MPSEDQILAALGAPPYASFARAHALGGYERLGIDPDVDLLLARAERGFACIVVGQSAFQHGCRHGLRSPFGTLSSGHHAIVIVGLDGDDLRYFDPWFPTAGQPLRVGLDDFVRDWWVSGLLGV